MPLNELPTSPDEAFVTKIAEAIRDVLIQVAYVGHVYLEPQYVSAKPEDEAKTKADDPVMGDKHRITNFIEIGIPDPMTEDEYSGDDEVDTTLTLTFPIRFALGVVPAWNKTGFPYKSSAQMYLGTFIRARKLFKRDRSLGYRHVTHYYLQEDGYSELVNEKGESLEHLGDWSLTVRVEGNY